LAGTFLCHFLTKNVLTFYTDGVIKEQLKKDPKPKRKHENLENVFREQGAVVSRHSDCDYVSQSGRSQRGADNKYYQKR
jgi:hypothetical protein